MNAASVILKEWIDVFERMLHQYYWSTVQYSPVIVPHLQQPFLIRRSKYGTVQHKDSTVQCCTPTGIGSTSSGSGRDMYAVVIWTGSSSSSFSINCHRVNSEIYGSHVTTLRSVFKS
jgi:hypothetical protein